MKVVKSLMFILFVLCGLSGKAQEVAADSTGYIVRVGEMAPNFTITLTDGKKVTFSELRGKVVMLQFTASWCGVCRKEMPFIEKDIWLKHKDNSAFVLIGIDRDEPLDKVIAFGKSTGVTYPLGLDPGACFQHKHNKIRQFLLLFFPAYLLIPLNFIKGAVAFTTAPDFILV